MLIICRDPNETHVSVTCQVTNHGVLEDVSYLPFYLTAKLGQQRLQNELAAVELVALLESSPAVPSPLPW